ncbi:MAG: PGF-pre-PGF domain-containing protein [Nanoarchaeota archaeon]|nr:PGF-pre-PGF domain-containing protein [Nanoarchaeota archaeon]MBU4300812.1 PGF-pre-PGF domain-containing protein [Nanoarchaeota archaeon]MBU4451487.1 PGF-pre-PGF domain-containing protein [Nanoarchaeota archaeon]MCG2723862.1 PGF-pre-PGF domain-containing protein [archaeon]
MKSIVSLIMLLLLVPAANALSITVNPLSASIAPGSDRTISLEVSGNGTYALEIIRCTSASEGCTFAGSDMLPITFDETKSATNSITVSGSGTKSITASLSSSFKESIVYSYKIYAKNMNNTENASVTGDVRYIAPAALGVGSNTGGGMGISAGTIKITLALKDSPFKKILVNFKSSMNNPSITASLLTDVPVLTSLESEDLVYQYLEIKKRNFNDSDISEAVIEFTVNKSWMAANNISEIYLKRYDNGWKPLRTELIDSTETLNTYRAYVYGFSYFAVFGKVEKSMPLAAPKPENNIIPSEIEVSSGIAATTPIQEKSPTGFALFESSKNAEIVAVALLLGFGIAYYLKRK